jgi:hypothetical protein
MKHLSQYALWTFLIVPFSGCGNASVEKLGPELRKFALAYHEYAADKGKGPGRLDDLAAQEAGFPAVAKLIRNGDFVVVWGAKLFAESDKNDAHLLGYENVVPEKGGMILTAGGATRKVSAEEFRGIQRIPSASQ